MMPETLTGKSVTATNYYIKLACKITIQISRVIDMTAT